MTLRRRPSRLPALACALLTGLTFGGAAAAASAAAPGAFTGPDDPGLPALITGLRSCLSHLPAADRQVLALRAGLGGHAARLTAEVAATLGQSAVAVSAAEVSAVRKLEAQRRRGVCQGQSPTTPAAAPAAAPATPAAPQTTPTTPARPQTPTTTPARPQTTTAASRAAAGSAGSGGSSVNLLDIAIPALLALAFIAGISREMLRDPRS